MNISSSGISGAAARAAYPIPEIAEKLGCSDATVWRLIKKGQLESVKIGGMRRVTATGFEKLLTANAA